MNKKPPLLYRLAAAPHIVWSALFIIAPLIFVVYFAFTDAEGSFTFDNILALSEHTETFFLSVAFSLIATVICLLVGYPLAYSLTKMKPRTQKILIMLVMLPMWMNLLIRTYSWTTILEKTGLINSFLGFFGVEPLKLIGTPGAVILGMVYNYIPYMILPIYTVMTKIDNSLLEAAEDLGSNGWSKLKRVILPLSLPGVISGITMVFVPSVSTFYISQKLGGAQTLMIGDIIQKRFDALSYNTGAALSLIMMVVILISLAIMNRFTDDDDGGIIL